MRAHGVFAPSLLIGLTSLTLLLPAGPATAHAADPPHQPFRVLSYNVRQVNDADTGDYTWTNRSPHVVELIAANDPDIWGVQESSARVIQEDLASAFDATHDRFQPPNGSPKTIFFRRGRFERLFPDNPAEGEGMITIRNPYAESDPCFDNGRGRTSAWVKLRDLDSGRGYLIVNAHVAHASDCYEARNVAAESLHELLAAQSDGLSIVLFGDLNSDPQRSAGNPDDDRIVALLETPQPGYTLRRSARHTGTTTEDTATFNSSWKSPSSSYARLDYIFTSIADATTYHQLVDRRLNPDGIPPSDHFAIAAHIRQAPFAPDARVATHEGAAGDQLAFADVDGDGAADQLVWNPAVEGGAVRTFLADRSGGFAATAVVDAAPTAAAESLFFADVDGDGCADRLAWSPTAGGGTLRVSRSACDGTFEAATTAGPASTVATTRWSFARIDSDRCLDAILWDPAAAGGRPRVALSRCDGTFADPIENTDEGTSTNPDATIGFADVNGDGLADKIVWDRTAFDGHTRVFAGQGDGTFAFLQDHTGGSSGVAASRFFYADVDGDGHADKIFWRSNFREGFPQIYRGGPEGFDPHPAMVNAGASTSATNRYFLADVDGNGSADLVAWDPAASGGSRIGETRAYLALVGAPDAPGPGPGPDGGPAGDGGPAADGPVAPDDDAGPGPGPGPGPGGDAGAPLDGGVDGGNPGVPGGSLSGQGCGCRTTASSGGGEGAGSALLVLLALVSLRARRRH